ncbi:MAG: MerR family transcriptional regulator [Oscillospiraceae bacterium]|nr:MerR family transcriptional regulator [Oscillospiraceae bacterium]
MEKHRAIPNGYMTVGEVAKKMNTTVRTLQYYDKEGLLSPSAESEGGRRLYTDKDVLHLYQILSLKSLGFSLSDIKNRLITLESPTDVANMLTEQASALREQVDTLSDSLEAIEALKVEVLQMQSVNFRKYADIISSLRRKNEMYWAIKHFDDHLLDRVRDRFQAIGSDLGIPETQARLHKEALRLQAAGVPPESETGQALAAEFWDMITTFTDGDISLLSTMQDVEKNMAAHWTEMQKQQYEQANHYLQIALDTYFQTINYNPFEEAQP